MVINGNVEIGAPVIWTWVSRGGLGLVERELCGWCRPEVSSIQQDFFGVLLLAARRTLQRQSGRAGGYPGTPGTVAQRAQEHVHGTGEHIGRR